MMLKGKAIRVEGWGRDSDRLGRMMCCDLLVGRGAESFFGCHVYSMFDEDGAPVRNIKIINE